VVTDFNSVFIELQSMGFTTYILPFLLFFAIIFAVLEKLKIFGDNKTNINLMLGIILGLLVVVQQEIVTAVNSFLPKVSLFILVALMFLVIAGLFGAKTGNWGGIALPIALVICIVAIIWALYPSTSGNLWDLPSWLRPDSQNRAWIILIVTVVIVIAFLTGGGNSQPKSWNEKLFGP